MLDWCCLRQDLAALEKGDKTVIEEKSNVSGGQKARIALARAIYSQRPILILDDPLASLDINVGQKIMDNLHRLCK